MAVSFTPTTVSNPEGAQGTYPQTLKKGHEGMVADLQAYVSRSYRNQSGAAIPFGVLVMTDNTPTSNDPFAVDIATGATGIVGLSISTLTMEGQSGGSAYVPNPTPLAADGRVGYPDKQTMNVLSKGVVWVYSTEAIALGDAVRYWDTAHHPTVAGAFHGRFCKSASGTRTTAITAGARWLSETTSAGLVLLELDLPAAAFAADA
jgi:hypothetical protein